MSRLLTWIGIDAQSLVGLQARASKRAAIAFPTVEKFWIGGMYRSGDSFGAIAQWIINKKIRIGYAADFTFTELKDYHKGIHEVMISYEIDFTKRRYVSPRYF